MKLSTRWADDKFLNGDSISQASLGKMKYEMLSFMPFTPAELKTAISHVGYDGATEYKVTV